MASSTPQNILSGDALPSSFCLFMVQVIFILALSKVVTFILKPVRRSSKAGVGGSAARFPPPLSGCDTRVITLALWTTKPSD